MRSLVTGASGGIGRATALRLARDGSDVALHFHRNREGAESLAREVISIGRDAPLVSADLAAAEAPSQIASELARNWPTLDVLVHNAGVYDRAGFETLTSQDWEAAIALHLVGPARLTQSLLPLLRRSAGGRIIFVSSLLAFTGSKWGAHYAAAKAGVLGLARSLARELAPGITVNVVAPGSIDTAIIAHDTPEARAERGRITPLARVGRPEEVADAIAFLASDRASYITGATLHVNGGLRFD